MVVQPFTVRVNYQRGKVLNVANFVFSTHTDFIERIPGDGTIGSCRFEFQTQILGVFFTPARRHRPQFTFKVSHYR